MNRRHLLTSLAALPFAVPVLAGSDRVATNQRGVAMQGYDTHAYWRVNAAREGSSEFIVQWRGVPWHFASAADAEMFRATPEAFEPQFGGFCTRALSFKKIVDGNPEVWRIHGAKLYLFARPVGGEYFDKDEDAMIVKAQAYWDTLS